jgi:hypothetical protein
MQSRQPILKCYHGHGPPPSGWLPWSVREGCRLVRSWRGGGAGSGALQPRSGQTASESTYTVVAMIPAVPSRRRCARDAPCPHVHGASCCPFAPQHRHRGEERASLHVMQRHLSWRGAPHMHGPPGHTCCMAEAPHAQRAALHGGIRAGGTGRPLLSGPIGAAHTFMSATFVPVHHATSHKPCTPPGPTQCSANARPRRSWPRRAAAGARFIRESWAAGTWPCPVASSGTRWPQPSGRRTHAALSTSTRDRTCPNASWPA